MEIIVIAAMAKNRVIGKDNQIPWHIKEDFQHFKEKTSGHPCIMGRKTYESLPDNAKPLPGRENIILTTQQDYSQPGTTVFHNLNKALEYCQNKGFEKIFIIGGASLYASGLQVADTLELTIIDKEFDGDTFFPEIDYDLWELTNQEDHQGLDIKSKEELKFSFLTYQRKK
ncbi:dihydrofolate reductase [Nanoarchaeota archaeon]